MAAYCHRIDLDGFANFFKIQFEEEHFHAMKFFEFLNEMDVDIDIRGFDTPPSNDYENIVDVFEHSLAHEKKL